MDLPLRGTKNAPRKFKGKYNQIKEFFSEVESVCTAKNITSNEEKCKAVLRYCSHQVTKVINGLQQFKDNNYDALKTELLFMYDGDRTEVEYSISDIGPLIKKWRSNKVSDQSSYREYYREFQQVAGWLHVRQKVTDEEFKLWFWAGLPRRLQREIKTHMRIRNPNLDVTKPFEVEKVTSAVQKLYPRDRFEDRIPFLIKGAPEKQNADESGSDASDEEDGSKTSSESEEEVIRMPSAKGKASTKNNKSVKFSAGETSRKEALMKGGNDDTSVDALIHQMKALNLNDPRHRVYWLQVRRDDPVMREKVREINALTFSSNFAPDERREAPPDTNRGTRFIGNTNTGGGRDDRRCYACGETGHTMARCDRIHALADKKIIRRDENRRWIWSDGSPIVQKEGESIINAIERGIKRAALVTLAPPEEESIYVYGDRDESDDGMESGDDDEAPPNWCLYGGGSASVDRDSDKENRPPFGNADERNGYLNPTGANRETLAVDRREPLMKSARFRPNERGHPHKSTGKAAAGNPWSKKDTARDDRVVPVESEANRKHRNDENSPKGKSDNTPRKEAAVGGRDAGPEPMMVDEEVPRSKGQEAVESGRRPRSNWARDGTSIRSAVTTEAALEIVSRLMRGDVTLPLGQLLSLAPELQKGLGKAMKGPVIREEQIPFQKVERPVTKQLAAVMRPRDDGIPEELRSLGLGSSNGKLIKVEARIGKARMKAVIDTGAEVNIISERMFKRTGLPRNFETTPLGDVNDGVKASLGKIKWAKIYLTPNRLLTIGELCVHNIEKFDLLLGREWQERNYGGTQDTEDGTLLRFTSRGVKYEMNVQPIAPGQEETDEESEIDLPKEECPRPHQGRRNACVVTVEGSNEEQDRPAEDELRRERGGVEPEERRTIEGLGRSWTYDGPQRPQIEQWRDSVGMSQGNVASEPSTYLADGKGEWSPEPGGNKFDYIEETPQRPQEGWSEDEELEEGELEDAKSPLPRKRARRESEEEETKRRTEIDEESDYWHEARSRNERRLRKRHRCRRVRHKELGIEERFHENLIQTIMKGGTNDDWETHLDSHPSLRRAHPWSDWSSEDLKTEWNMSEHQEEQTLNPETVPENLGFSPPPNNQEALNRNQKGKARVSTKGLMDEIVPRRSTRRMKPTEKENGEEWQ